MPSHYNDSLTATAIPELEKEVLAFWQENKIFQQSVDQRPIDNQFVLYDGPPFATGLPHYGHILAHAIKDAIPRYQTMQGKRVERRFGWDCHGVPVEHIVTEAMNLKTKQDIEKLGVAEFNEACRAIVQRYTNEWRAVEDRLGRFVDMDNDYKTMDLDFMESVWAVFKKINDKGLVYEGKKVVAYSPELGTALSDFESKLNYKTIPDPEIVMQFPLVDEPNVALLVWTTTPWSVPGNVAIAVNKNIEYVKVVIESNAAFILAKNMVEKKFKNKTIVSCEPIAIESLLGKRYQPMFTHEIDKCGSECFTIIESNHVTDIDGTGLVHIACAFGEDDYKLGQKYQLPTLDYFDTNGCFTQDLTDLFANNVKGKSFKDADKILMDWMKKQGRMFHQGTFSHEYPHCWRTDKPLMYRAVSSWYVEVTAIKDKIIANNDKINWYPDYVGKKRFHEWLSNANDWAISRSRYWGTPIPVWRNIADGSDCIVIGSLAELKEFTGVEAKDLHRHFIDDLAVTKDGKEYRRIPEVFDCWFESGAMPYAQAHYPFENVQAFENTFPADFIAEGLDQTRGWFYTLMVLSTALFDKPAFKNCMVNGILLGDDGKKMSKSKRNYPEMSAVFEKYGADSLRFLLLGSGSTQAKEMKVSEADIKNITRLVLLPMLHIFKLFALKANQLNFKVDATDLAEVRFTTPLDQWLFSATENFKAALKKAYDNYDLISACHEIRNFIDLFSKLYTRNSKQRFKNSHVEDIQQGLLCMHHALDTLSKCIAPIIPFMGDILFQALHGKDKSVHLEFWPRSLDINQYRNAFTSIEVCRMIIRMGNSVRQEQSLELTQPLSELALSEDLREQLLSHVDMLKEALNVENIVWVNGSVSEMLEVKLVLNAKVLGQKYKIEFLEIKKSFEKGDYTFTNGVLVVNGKELLANEFAISYKPLGHVCGAAEGNVWLTLDCELTPELIEKGRLRKFMHEIQMLRKEGKYTPSDRIEVQISGSEDFQAFINKHEATICNNTFSVLRMVETVADVELSRSFGSKDFQGQLGAPSVKASVSVSPAAAVFFSSTNLTLFAPPRDEAKDEEKITLGLNDVEINTSKFGFGTR